MDPVSIYDFRGRILRDTFPGGFDHDTGMLVFSLLHFYMIEISGNVLSDRPHLGAGTQLAADTWHGCAAAIASLWSGLKDERASDSYWYAHWPEWGGYARAQNLSAAEKAKLLDLMAALERHPFVTRSVPGDDGLLGETERRCLRCRSVQSSCRATLRGSRTL